MPKEVVRGRLNRNWFAQVGWTKGRGEVQVSTVARDMPLVTDESTKVNNGWHIDLDEDGLEQLILNLQKAGREAFGVRPW